ncbi:glycosyltransferase family 4 protein [Pseudactinotalea sp.]|uniref:glycosyltransferase family 4 protein n=1 Tax=Pseudactinotalea sp. TaxID=1926260 RepID=UPI003B3A804F
MAGLAQRGRSLALDLVLTRPLLVRGDALAEALRRELVRRLDGSPDPRIRRLWSRHLRSRNRAASRAAAAAVVVAKDPTPLLPELQRLVSRRPGDVALRLDLCAALRRTGQPGRAAEIFGGLMVVRAGDVSALVREALALAGREGAGELLRRLAPADDQAERQLRGALTLADGVPPGAPADVVRARSHDPAVHAAAVVYAGSYSERAEVARAVLEGSGTDDATSSTLATLLRDDGDLRLSTALAERVLERHPRDPVMRRTATLGRSGLDSLEHGWAPPPARDTAGGPHDRRVHYLLHSSLPHTSLGYATRTQGLLRALREGGWDVRGVTQPGYPEHIAKHPPRDEVDGVPYLRLPMEGALPHWPIQRMVDAYRGALGPLVAAERPGIVHAASNVRNGFAAVDVARRTGIASVYEVRGLWEFTRLVREPEFDQTEMFELLERLEAQAATLADRAVVITRALGDHLVGLGVPEERIVVVPNGVDTSRFEPREPDTELARRLGVDGKTVIGYVGGLVEYEGLDLLVEAAAQLSRERDDFRVLIVGDGRSLPGLRAAVTAREIDHLVLFTGRVPHEQVEQYYSLIDIAPFPRLPEKVCELVSPLKPFEAMAMGKAVVASDVAALAEIVDDGATGRLFTKGSAPALAQALRSLLDSPEQRAAVAARGLRWVREQRDWHTIVPRVGQLYEELWQERWPVLEP